MKNEPNNPNGPNEPFYIKSLIDNEWFEKDELVLVKNHSGDDRWWETVGFTRKWDPAGYIILKSKAKIMSKEEYPEYYL
jgi:hypothetical protein